ncbi:putative Na+/H+ antiporter [Curvibacter sp. HBC28]|uniref:Na+/H+ antiporter n=1 Tax=Curvibacter microcysteis TaxID=3026419 RepID=A0ABT5MHN2_9BURK|nr:putative Na+/H+ antiporter [Curvibacter sp. HBC28]MDD0815494.1 putative Na+/H+ antiporter [Curvibacter sp. HBC28]
MSNPSTLQWIGAALFAIALLHTFSTKFFEHLAHTRPRHAGLWHLLGEVEVVFGFWAMVLMVLMFALQGQEAATQYLNSRNFTEPLFVFAIMVIAGTRPILQVAARLVHGVAQRLPLPWAMATCFVLLSLVPLLGSFITEPAAMTLAALMLRDSLFSQGLSTRLRYAVLGVLFVNVSIGGTLTPFAAPPILMVAHTWQWDLAFVLTTLGWKAAVAVLVNAAGLVALFQRELRALPPQPRRREAHPPVPAALVLVHLLFLLGVVVFAHHLTVFLGLFLFFLGLATAYQSHQNPLILREALLVAFFLAGLVVLGGQQQWWLQPLLLSLDSDSVYLGATALTAITDNAALTYLGSLVPGLSDDFKVALVAGAVTGGGLTVIANAPNPAGVAILRGHFEEQSIHPLGLLLAALPATGVAMLALRGL